MSRYETHLWKDPQLPFIFKCLTRDHTNRATSGTNWHENIELVLAWEGEGYVLCDGCRVDLHAGELAVISPNAMHDVYSDSSLTYWYLIVDRSFCQANYFDTNLLSFRHEAIRDPVLSECFARLIAEYRGEVSTPFRTQMIRGTVLTAMALLCRNYGESVAWRDDPRVLSAVKQVIGRIRSEFASPDLSPVELADSVGLSRYYFAHKFRQVTGFTCAGYINLTRCERAKELLAEGRLENGEIARLCGFGSHSYFARVFHAIVGMSPSAYRVLCEKEN